MNTVLISGAVVGEPERKEFASGSVMVAVTVRVAGYAKAGEEPKTDDLRVEGWAKVAELLAALSDGVRVIVSGSVRASTWKTQGGEARSRMYVAAQHVERLALLPAAGNGTAPARATGPVPADDDAGFPF